MTREEGRIDVLAELGEVAVPERSGAEDGAGAARFERSLVRLKAKRARPRARRSRVALFGAGVAAAAAAVVVTLAMRRGEQPASGPSDALASSTQVEVDATNGEAARTLDDEGREWLVTAGESTALVRMVSGARAMVGPSSKAWCWSEPSPSWLHLEMGQVDVSVPKLRLGQSLTIHTPNASVIVHGTAFTVQVIGTDPPVTTVVVREGVVEVREGESFTFLHAGEVWRSGLKGSVSPSATTDAAVAIPAPPVAPAPAPADRPSDRAAKGPAARVPLASASVGESSLARENALFREASQAKQRGDFESSQSTLEKLLIEFPRSPLRASALVERAFALSRLGRASEAAVVAKQALSEGAAEHVREPLWQIAFGTKPEGSAKPAPAPPP